MHASEFIVVDVLKPIRIGGLVIMPGSRVRIYQGVAISWKANGTVDYVDDPTDKPASGATPDVARRKAKPAPSAKRRKPR